MRHIATTFLVSCISAIEPQALASDFAVGDLSYEDCAGSEDYQEYWYRRKPPLVGYRNGERLSAGGDGTCVLGFARGAAIKVNGERVSLTRYSENGKVIYESADGATRVVLEVTGQETTCAPEGESCCGDYTFATLSVFHGEQQTILYVVSYVGG